MTGIAKTYGRALYELAREESIGEELLQEMEAVRDILDAEPEYVRILSAVSVPKAERCALVDEAFTGRIHPYLMHFIKILCENGTIKEFSGCLEEYRSEYNEDNGILEVRAVSAVALTDEQSGRLCAKLAEVTGKKIQLIRTVDPAVMGGMRVEYAGRSYDGTIAGRLERLGRSLDGLAI